MNEPRHTLAILRRTLGLKQKEMAALAGCSAPTIQAIEYGKLQLSEHLAGLISLRTGVALQWLLENRLDMPPLASDGSPYTQETFHQSRAVDTDKTPPTFRHLQPILSYSATAYRLGVLLLKAAREQKTQLCAYKISRAFDDLDQTFSVTDSDKAFFNKFFSEARDKNAKNTPGHAPLAALVHGLRVIDPEFYRSQQITSASDISLVVNSGGEISSLKTTRKPSAPAPKKSTAKPQSQPSKTRLRKPKARPAR